MKAIEGSRGEGGGQVARVALALAAATRTAVAVENIRANRDPPGLKAGHLAAVRAIEQLCDGTIEGAALGSQRVTLVPGAMVGGEHRFAIQTAGPVTLLAQALLPACVASRQPFTLHLEGGTNVAWAPQWDDFANVHLPLLRRLGIEATATLARRGFFPVGGGVATLEVATPSLAPAAYDEAGDLVAVHATLASHGLPAHVVDRAKGALAGAFPAAHVEVDAHRGPGAGFAVSLRAECRRTILGADAVGKKGVRVEHLIEDATARLRAELASGAGVDVHQADQLPIFLALAGGGSFTTRMLSPHARTVLGLLPEFLAIAVETRQDGPRTRVEIRRA